ncbi:MAG: butyrate kinase [Bacillota bacterium]
MADNMILVINPGSTSTKLALYQGQQEVMTSTIEHSQKELADFEKITDQLDLRVKYIRKFMQDNDVSLSQLDAVVGRGGLLKPIPGGTYKVNEKMLEDLKAGLQGEHASNLGGLIADSLAAEAEAPAFIVDPVVVDELTDLARLSGHPRFARRSIFHALNQKAVARNYAQEKGKSYDEITVIVAHLGGGISVGLHHEGRVKDVNNALAGEGPYSPNRAGGLPTYDLAAHCYEPGNDFSAVKKKLLGEGGVVAYLNTNDMREVEDKALAGDEEADLIYRGMAYQTAKEIASLAPIVNGEVEAIILTGGIAYSDYFVQIIKEKTSFIAPIKVYPGEEEMAALAAGAQRVLTGQEEAKTYQ